MESDHLLLHFSHYVISNTIKYNKSLECFKTRKMKENYGWLRIQRITLKAVINEQFKEKSLCSDPVVSEVLSGDSAADWPFSLYLGVVFCSFTFKSKWAVNPAVIEMCIRWRKLASLLWTDLWQRNTALYSNWAYSREKQKTVRQNTKVNSGSVLLCLYDQSTMH